MRCLLFVFQLLLILVQWDTSKVTPEPQFWFVEVATKSSEVFVYLVSQFTSMASHNAAMFFILTILTGVKLVQNRNDEHCCFSHTRFSLAENIMTLQDVWDRVDLNFARMFEATFSNSSFEFIFEEKFIPTSKVRTELSFGLPFVVGNLFFIRFVVWNIHNLLYLNITSQQIQSYLNCILPLFPNEPHSSLSPSIYPLLLLIP